MSTALVRAPAGSGKTFACLESLAKTGRRAIYVVPTHELGEQIEADLRQRGVSCHRWRGGPTKEDSCTHIDAVSFFRENLYIAQRGPCKRCEQSKSCPYLDQYGAPENETAQVLILTAWHLRRYDLWRSRATRGRCLVILDEDAVNELAPAVELHVRRLRAFLAHADKVGDKLVAAASAHENRSEGSGEQDLPWPHVPSAEEATLLSTLGVLRRAAQRLLNLCENSRSGRWMKKEEALPDFTLDDSYAVALSSDLYGLIGAAYEVVADGVPLPNIFAQLREMLIDADIVHVTKGAVRYVRRPRVPDDHDLLLLDATAEPRVVGAILQRDVRVTERPSKIEQKARLVQIMDLVATRAGVRRDLDQKNRSWARRLVEEVGRRHKGQRLLCITFLRHEEEFEEILAKVHGDATVAHYGALRGPNAFAGHQVALILGRPMPNEVVLQTLAVAAFGEEALSDSLEPPSLEWSLQEVRIGPETWQVRCQRYGDDDWDAVWRHVVVGELLQAIGRLRPLQNPGLIYVATNEPLGSDLEVIPAYAGEIFPGMALLGRRSEFARNVLRYAETKAKLAKEGKQPTNAAICRAMGTSERNGLRYKVLADVVGPVSYPLSDPKG